MGIICYFVLSFCFKFVFQIFWPGKYVFIGVASGVVGQFVILDSIYIDIFLIEFTGKALNF